MGIIFIRITWLYFFVRSCFNLLLLSVFLHKIIDFLLQLRLSWDFLFVTFFLVILLLCYCFQNHHFKFFPDFQDNKSIHGCIMNLRLHQRPTLPVSHCILLTNLFPNTYLLIDFRPNCLFILTNFWYYSFTSITLHTGRGSEKKFAIPPISSWIVWPIMIFYLLLKYSQKNPLI